MVSETFPQPGGPRLGQLLRERSVDVSAGTRRTVDIAVGIALAALLLSFFRPDLLLSQTTTTGGDTGAHIYTPWYLKTHLLPQGQISGWSPDWYAGFPILHFYFPFVVAVQAVLSFAIPYEVAFKIGTVLGVFFFPVAVYLFFRLLRLPFPTPVVGAILSLGFLFMDSFDIHGGNILSTLAGEYSFSLSLGLVLVFLGLAYRVATGDHGRPLLAGGVLAIAALSHLVPVMVAVCCIPLLLYWSAAAHGARRGLLLLAEVFGLAFALTAFWSVPFLVRLEYSADMRWYPLEGLEPLVPGELWVPLLGAALAGLVATLRRDGRILLFLVPAAAGVLLFLLVGPGWLFDGTIWNGRFLPFWYLGVFLTTAYLVGSALPWAAALGGPRRAAPVTVVIVGAVAAATVGAVLNDRDASPVDDWIRHNYAGYEGQDAFPTFAALLERIEQLPPGRIMWEPSPELGELGTPVAPMTIPYWTGHPVMEGIYYESSITTPFHFVMASELAHQPSNPIPSLPYEELDMERGLQHMRLFDISYFLTVSEQARQAAAQTPGLRRLTDVDRFSLFAIDPPGHVVVPEYEPVVLSAGDWIDENLEWFAHLDGLQVPLVREGPDDWQRIPAFTSPLPRRPVSGGGRSLPADVGHDEITFTTDAIGEPHWVKTSYFPNWRAEGALGPYLASPSMMMVVPTQPDVRLSYGRTWAEWAGLAATLSALLLVARAVVRGRRITRRRRGSRADAR